MANTCYIRHLLLIWTPWTPQFYKVVRDEKEKRKKVEIKVLRFALSRVSTWQESWYTGQNGHLCPLFQDTQPCPALSWGVHRGREGKKVRTCASILRMEVRKLAFKIKSEAFYLTSPAWQSVLTLEMKKTGRNLTQFRNPWESSPKITIIDSIDA